MPASATTASIGLGDKDNFWAMGDTGPCGPCSEIHFFQGDDCPAPRRRRAHVPRRACECDRWMEIWNLVFMQFERKEKDGRSSRCRAVIDTGAGLERVTAVVQGKRSNYDTDLFAPLARAGRRALRASPTAATRTDDVSMRVIADHARATAFLDRRRRAALNEGRGYVLRRIMRRAIRHG